LTLNMRATSGGGTATATAITRTLDAAPPTDGTLIATPGNAQVVLTWSGFADAGSGLAVYKVVWSDITPTVSCTGNAFGYSGTSTSFTHSGLVNGAVYSYRVCAFDNVGNVSPGATASATPQGPDTTPPVPGVLTVSGPQFASFVGSPFALTANFTDNESAVTSCQYTVDGTTCLPATVSPTSPTFTRTTTAPPP